MALKYLIWQGVDAGVGIGIVSTPGSMSITHVNHSISQVSQVSQVSQFSQVSPAPRFGKERRG